MSVKQRPVSQNLTARGRRRRRCTAVAALTLTVGATALAARGAGPAPAEGITGPYVLLAYNDLGMHCMNEDFSELVILPPFNTVRAQLIRRGESPEPVAEDDITISYRIPTNTHSSDKTNFWEYAEAIFGTPIPPDRGLTGNGMSGSMERRPGKYYEVTGIPITPIDDSGRLDPYPIGTFDATGPLGTASTRAVVPVSTEISCNLCHTASGGNTVAHEILVTHDTMHGTDLVHQKPVLCASCHADPALGAPGDPSLPTLSAAMHGADADRMDAIPLQNTCYACHPGLRTDCQRDVHLANGVNCVDCHGGMEAVGDPARTPWVDQPRCGDCHARPGFEFEPPGVLFKDATGHGGVLCSACHGSPHAIGPAVTPVDDLQVELLQGFAGVLSDCTVCHIQMPSDPFPHRGDDD